MYSCVNVKPEDLVQTELTGERRMIMSSFLLLVKKKQKRNCSYVMTARKAMLLDSSSRYRNLSWNNRILIVSRSSYAQVHVIS